MCNTLIPRKKGTTPTARREGITVAIILHDEAAGRLESDAADVEILFKAVGLQQVESFNTPTLRRLSWISRCRQRITRRTFSSVEPCCSSSYHWRSHFSSAVFGSA